MGLEDRKFLSCELHRAVAERKTRALMTVWVFFLLILMSGCFNLKHGFPPNIDGLKTLIPGESKSADVLLTLGEPRGYGKSRWAAPLGTNVSADFDIWEYEYTVSDGRKAKLTILILFFDGEVYEGHLWFSSGLVTKEE